MIENKLFIIPHPKPNPALRLFCFPYAGGNASTYLNWSHQLPDEIELIAVQPPGRATRIIEQAHNTMDHLVSEILLHANEITATPYAFFGHSLGSRVAYELASRLEQMNLPTPHFIIASGSKAPHLPFTETYSYNLPDLQFKEKLKSLNGTPKEVLENDELMNFVLPLLRADFAIAECYQATPKKLSCPIHVISGTEDVKITKDQLTAWQTLTHNEVNINYLSGDHFFVEKNKTAVISHLNQILMNMTNEIA
ncbi:thioesterase II family protein [Flocculibacter collagenilyticus]|uniref:thioesterase II family protein n=1 Tax=Flocculibacter collagenilyticus TaxID=2744479 RepID=UPI001F1AE8D4|nr:thioesterase domain-containing protein [Flocculibacter collagenilyticus]